MMQIIMICADGELGFVELKFSNLIFQTKHLNSKVDNNSSFPSILFE
jgi:hypothetical protein